MARQLRRLEPKEIAVGVDSSLSISLYDANGDALTVVGASATWKIYEAVPRRRRKPFTGDALATKTSAAAEITLATGLATIAIADTDLDGKSGNHWHSLQLTDSSGNVTHYGQGEIFLRAAF